MFPRSLPVVLGVVACAVGCAAAQVDDMPNNSDPDDKPSTGGSNAGSGAGGTKPAEAGSSSATAGTSTKGGTGSGGASTGTAGAGHAGSAGKGAGGGSTGGTGTGGGSGSAGTGTGGTKPANTNLPFTEDFEDGEANGFIPWNEDMTQGMWAVVADGAGKVYQPVAAVSDLEFGVGGSTTWSDVAMTVKVRLKDDASSAQILLRFKDPKTYLVVEMAVGKYKLRARNAGSTTDLISPSPKPVITGGKWYTVGITAKGTTVNLTLDGMPIGATVMCAAAISNGGVALGVAEGSVSFDDLNVVAAP
jgi:hypothetical protein